MSAFNWGMAVGMVTVLLIQFLDQLVQALMEELGRRVRAVIKESRDQDDDSTN